jgi:hypothetical protein
MPVALISKPPPRIDFASQSAVDLFIKSGQNTGNYAFIQAVDRQIIADRKVYVDWDFDPDFINKNFDRVLLVCANMVNPDVNLHDLHDRVSQVRIPMSAVSVGVQAPIGAPIVVDHPTTASFFQMLSSKCQSFGLRGEITANYMTSIGVTNFRIIGCPSNFLNCSKDLGARICNQAHDATRIAVHLDRPDGMKTDNYMVETDRLLGQRDRLYFVQSPFEYIELGWSVEGEPVSSQSQKILKNAFGWDGQSDPARYARRNIACYFDVDYWARDLARFDFSFGFRLHGNILAIQAGIPALAFTHDNRVKELATTIGLPMIDLPSLGTVESLEELIEVSTRGLQYYDQKRAHLATEYTSLLSENGFAYIDSLNNFQI